MISGGREGQQAGNIPGTTRGALTQEQVGSLREANWAAARLGISRWAVYELAKRRVLPHVRIGRLIRFDENAIEAWIAAGGTGGEDVESWTPNVTPFRS